MGYLYIPGKPARNLGLFASVGAANSHRNQARTSIKVFPRGELREGDQENGICQGPETRKQKVFLKHRCFVGASWGGSVGDLRLKGRVQKDRWNAMSPPKSSEHQEDSEHALTPVPPEPKAPDPLT